MKTQYLFQTKEPLPEVAGLLAHGKKYFALEDYLREDENSSESDNEENDKSEEDNQSDEIQESDTPGEEELPEPAAPPEPNRSIYSGRTRKPNSKYYF